MWPSESIEEESSPATKHTSVENGKPSVNPLPSAQACEKLTHGATKLPRKSFNGKTIPDNTTNDDSGFSEITSKFKVPEIGATASRSSSLADRESLDRIPDLSQPGQDSTSPLPKETDSPTRGFDQMANQFNEEEQLAEEIVSLTMDAEPTPVKPKPSLVERTRQSMAFASPGPRLAATESSLPPFFQPDEAKAANPDISNRGSLLERTRQSMSMVPPQPRASRKSINVRRNSKIYPTNQFETPRKPQTISELTPPDELFSPGAGYDSVFKSRPKVGFSPTISPVPGDDSIVSGSQDATRSSEDGLGWEGESSPLARMTARA